MLFNRKSFLLQNTKALSAPGFGKCKTELSKSLSRYEKWMCRKTQSFTGKNNFHK